MFLLDCLLVFYLTEQFAQFLNFADSPAIWASHKNTPIFKVFAILLKRSPFYQKWRLYFYKKTSYSILVIQSYTPHPRMKKTIGNRHAFLKIFIRIYQIIIKIKNLRQRKLETREKIFQRALRLGLRNTYSRDVYLNAIVVS